MKFIFVQVTDHVDYIGDQAYIPTRTNINYNRVMELFIGKDIVYDFVQHRAFFLYKGPIMV